MLGMDEATQQLDKLIAAEAAEAGGEADPLQDSATDGQRAARTETVKNADDPKLSEKSDTPATAEPKTEAATEKPDEKPKSRYQKARERQENSWKELNAQKEALKAERDAHQREREQFERERAEHAAKLAEAEKEFSPEQYEAAADKFDAEGKFDLAELARKKASDLRRNPAQKQSDALEAQKKEWALKAGVDFPDLAKDNSPLQVRVAQLLHDEPDFKNHPKGIYVAARIASLETEAAGVPVLKAQLGEKDKELGRLNARIKELEALTAAGGTGSATRLPGEKTFDQMSEDEQFHELMRQARETGILVR